MRHRVNSIVFVPEVQKGQKSKRKTLNHEQMGKNMDWTLMYLCFFQLFRLLLGPNKSTKLQQAYKTVSVKFTRSKKSFAYATNNPESCLVCFLISLVCTTLIPASVIRTSEMDKTSQIIISVHGHRQYIGSPVMFTIRMAPSEFLLDIDGDKW